MKPAAQSLIMVLGMHRSGTSALTRGLQVLGISLGDDLMPAAEANNGKGFWEDQDVVAFNDSLLASIGRSWRNVIPATPQQVEAWRRDGQAGIAARLLRTKMRGLSSFAIKDPRLALLLPFWTGVFRDLDLDVSYILALRHPDSVARSLAQRDGIGMDHANLMWLGHVLGSLMHTEGVARTVVDYDRLMQAPEAELRRIAAFLGRDIDPEELKVYRDEFLDPSLRHHHERLGRAGADAFYTPLVGEMFTTLTDLAADRGSLDSADMSARLSSWLAAYERMTPMLEIMDDLAARLEQASAELSRARKKAARPLNWSQMAWARLKQDVRAALRFHPEWRRLLSRLLRALTSRRVL